MQAISEIMTPDVHTIRPYATIEEVAQEMREGGFGVMPVGAVVAGIAVMLMFFVRWASHVVCDCVLS